MYRETLVLQVHGCTCIFTWVVVRIVVNGPNTRKVTPTLDCLEWLRFRISEGQVEEDRTCNLRFWSTRRSVQTRPITSRNALNLRLDAMYRPVTSNHVQPLCSQFCSQFDLTQRKNMCVP